MLPGRGDNPGHVKSTTYPVMAHVQDDMGAFVLGLTGKTSSSGTDSWNSSNECCWPPLDGAGPDDEGYIAAQIAAVCAPPVGTGRVPCDPKRIYIWGHSAGSAMAYRYACDHPSQIAAVFQMSTFAPRADGTTDPACMAGHFHLAHFGGTSDTVLYNNSSNGVLAPNTVEYVSVEVDRTSPTRTSTITQAISQNGCTGTAGTATNLGTLDFDSLVGADETDIRAITGCPSDGAVEIWRATGTAHVPTMTTAGKNAMIAWLLAHPKP